MLGSFEARESDHRAACVRSLERRNNKNLTRSRRAEISIKEVHDPCAYKSVHNSMKGGLIASEREVVKIRKIYIISSSLGLLCPLRTMNSP